MKRRRFAERVLAGVAIAVGPAACRGPTAIILGPADLEGAVGTNHGHRVLVSGAALAAGDALVLDIQGGSTHSHLLRLTADEVRRIRAGERVSQFSTDSFDDKHDHLVTFN